MKLNYKKFVQKVELVASRPKYYKIVQIHLIAYIDVKNIKTTC